jgi:glutaredoxin
MKNLPILLMLTLFFITSNSIAAVKIVECEDDQGNHSFQKVCPPGTALVGVKKISTETKPAVAEGNTEIVATIYTIPECEVCDQVKEFLQSRQISIKEKNANESTEIQKELSDLIGSLSVPTTIIGDTTISGHKRLELKAALQKAGYIEKKQTATPAQ